MDFKEYKNSTYWMQQRNTPQMTLGQLIAIILTFGLFPILLCIAAILEA